jgi:hypothetical protein
VKRRGGLREEIIFLAVAVLGADLADVGLSVAGNVAPKALRSERFIRGEPWNLWAARDTAHGQSGNSPE